MVYGGHHQLLPQPKPLRRKTSALDGYYKNGVPVSTAQIGDTVTWDVPGHSPGNVYLMQRVNGAQGYNGLIAVPMAPFTLTTGQPTGVWSNVVYDKDPAAGGSIIEQDQLTIMAAAQPSTPPPAKSTPPPATQPQQSGGGSSSSTTTTTSSTGGGPASGAGPLPAVAAPNDMLLLVAVAALALVVLAK